MKPFALTATAAAAAVAAFPLVSSQARATGNLVIAQMMNDDKGKQGMEGMEGHGGTAASNMQPQGSPWGMDRPACCHSGVGARLRASGGRSRRLFAY